MLCMHTANSMRCCRVPHYFPSIVKCHLYVDLHVFIAFHTECCFEIFGPCVQCLISIFHSLVSTLCSTSSSGY